MMNNFQATLSSFEPMTEGQKILHTETLRAYDQLIQARRPESQTVPIKKCVMTAAQKIPSTAAQTTSDK